MPKLPRPNREMEGVYLWAPFLLNVGEREGRMPEKKEKKGSDGKKGIIEWKRENVRKK